MHGCATAKVGPDANASPRCNCREAIHTFSRRASVYALGSDMKIDGGTFPNSSVGDCFLPPPLHNFLRPPFSCCLLGEYACWVPYQQPPLLSDTPILPGPPPQKPCSTGQTLCAWTWDIGGMSGRRGKKLTLRLKMFSQFKMED